MRMSIQGAEDLSELAERFLSSRVLQRAACLTELVDGLKRAIAAGQYDDAAMILRSVIGPSLDYTTARSLYRVRKELRGRTTLRADSIRLAVIGGFTTSQIVAFIDLCLFGAGVEAQIYEGDYGIFRQEIIDPDSDLYKFRPQVVWLAVARGDIGQQPSISGGRGNAKRSQ